MRRALLVLFAIVSCRQTAPAPAADRPPEDPAKEAAAEAAWTERLARARVDRLDAEGRVLAADRPLLEVLERPVALAFFATYCPPCLDEMPDLDALASEGRRVAGLSFDAGNAESLERVLAEKRVRYPVYVLTEPSLKALGAAMEEGLPLTLIVDAEGRVRRRLIGRSSRERVRSAIDVSAVR